MGWRLTLYSLRSYRTGYFNVRCADEKDVSGDGSGDLDGHATANNAMTQTNIGELLQKHERFWTPGSGSKPLVAECPHPDWRPKPYPLAGGTHVSDARRIAPQDIDVRGLLAADAGLPAQAGHLGGSGRALVSHHWAAVRGLGAAPDAAHAG